jgi:SAM-dependent methyltransferase
MLPGPVRMAIRNARILLDRPLDALEAGLATVQGEVQALRGKVEHLSTNLDGVSGALERVDRGMRELYNQARGEVAEVARALERVDRGLRDLFNQTRADILARTDVLLEVLDQRIDRVETGLRRQGAEGGPGGGPPGAAHEPLPKWPDPRRVDYRDGLAPEEVSLAAYLLSFVPDGEAREYAVEHMRRYLLTLRHVPPPAGAQPILDLGSNGQLLPALVTRHGYAAIRCGLHPRRGPPSPALVVAQAAGPERYAFPAEAFDFERDRFPYQEAEFQGVLCLEVLEHLTADPMGMLWEINRVLRPGGWLVLTTPNIASTRAIEGLLSGHAPYHFSQYYRDGSRDLRHNREYTPGEVAELLGLAGFEVTVTTEDAWWRPSPAILDLLEARGLPRTLRGDDIVAVGLRRGAPRERYPASLYV